MAKLSDSVYRIIEVVGISASFLGRRMVGHAVSETAKLVTSYDGVGA